MKLCALLLASASAFGQNLTPAAWLEDLDFLARELPAHHKNLFYTLKKEDFTARVAKISAGLPQMTEPEIRAALVRLVASVGNAHTSINVLAGTPMYPLQFAEFPEGYYVMAAANQEAIGARLISIGGVPAVEIRKRLVPMVPMETPLMEKNRLPGLLRSAVALGMESAAFRFEKDGRQFEVALEALPPRQQPKLETAQFPVPLYLSDRASAYWFRYLEKEKALYIQYNRCQDVPSHPFADFTKEVMAAAGQHPVEKIIVDLRHNGGGNSEVIRPLYRALKAGPRRQIFVLTSQETFSSGFLAEWEFKHQFKAQIVGEASSQRPNAYGDIRSLELPNSKLTVWYCTKYFKMASHGDPDSLPVDIPVETTAKDYFAGRDPVLERVLERGGR